MSQYQQSAQQSTGEQYGSTQHAPTQQGGQAPQQGQYQGAGGGQQADLFQTTSYLSGAVREQVIQCLNRTLADATVLQTHARFAHWNVKGMSFHGLHETFDDIVEALAEHIDTIGERVTALGGQATGTAGMAVAACRLPRMPTDVYTGQQFLEVMIDRLAVFDAILARDIQTASELDDPDTADLLNEVSRDVSKLRWFLEAHLQTQPIGTVGQGATASVAGAQGTADRQQQQTTAQTGGSQDRTQSAGQ